MDEPKSAETAVPAGDFEQSLSEYLGAQNLQALAPLELMPRRRTWSANPGNHKSIDLGSGIEFAMHRPYVKGDEIRRLDWNVYARTEKLQIKKFETHTGQKGVICLDLSGSMSFHGGEERWASKFDYACKLAAAVSFILLNQGDSLSLAILGSKVHSILPPSSSPAQITRVLSLLAEAKPEEPGADGEDPPLTELLHQLAGRFDHREMFIVISDFMEPAEKLSGFLGHLRHGNHEALLLQVMDPFEIDFPFRGWVRFQSLERTERLLLETGGLREAYMEALEEHLAELQRACLSFGMDHAVCRTSQPWVETLTAALVRRRLLTERR